MLDSHIEDDVTVDNKKYEFDATDFVLTGLSKFEYQGHWYGDEAGPKDGGPNYHNLEFFVGLGSQTTSVNGAVRYRRTEPKPEDPEKIVTGSVTSNIAEWKFKMILVIDVVKKTVVRAMAAPLGNPYLGSWQSNCVGQPVAKACPKIDKKINEGNGAIYGAIGKYISSELKKMQF